MQLNACVWMQREHVRAGMFSCRSTSLHSAPSLPVLTLTALPKLREEPNGALHLTGGVICICLHCTHTSVMWIHMLLCSAPPPFLFMFQNSPLLIFLPETSGETCIFLSHLDGDAMSHFCGRLFINLVFIIRKGQCILMNIRIDTHANMLEVCRIANLHL